MRVISPKYEGSINRFIGDCVLAFFGAPITHENDVERAVFAALDIRDSIKELNLDVSVGINTGMTYVGEMGSNLYCTQLKEEKGEALQDLKLNQCYLEPKELSGLSSETALVDEFDGTALKSGWEWVNPTRDSSYSLSSEAGWLEMRATLGSDLCPPPMGVFTAPRLLPGGASLAEAGLSSMAAIGKWKPRPAIAIQGCV